MKRLSALLIVVALTAAMTSCAVEADPTHRCNLTIASTDGGSVATPGEGTYIYEEGTVVKLVAPPSDGHRFVNWTGDVATVADVNAALTALTVNGDYSITLNLAEVHKKPIKIPGVGVYN